MNLLIDYISNTLNIAKFRGMRIVEDMSKNTELGFTALAKDDSGGVMQLQAVEY